MGSPFVFRPEANWSIENSFTYVAIEAQSNTETSQEISLLKDVTAEAVFS